MSARFRLVQTCGACPEQYDVYEGEEKVGYMRLRHGFFYAECQGKRVYEAHPLGDGLFRFDERDHHLTRACRAIAEELSGEPAQLYTVEDDTWGG